MLRISKLTDYGTVILAELAAQDERRASAATVAERTGLSLPTVRKLLKTLSKAGLVVATRGAQGGYQLARSPAQITAAEVIDALEGPVSITDCSASDKHCNIESLCAVGGAWQRINVAIRNALSEVSLADLRNTRLCLPSFNFAGTPVHIEMGEQ